MTLRRAYDLLRARWPGRSFLIQIACWPHDHLHEHNPQIEYRVYDAQDHESWDAPTLAGVMDLALGCDAALEAVEAQLRGVTPHE